MIPRDNLCLTQPIITFVLFWALLLFLPTAMASERIGLVKTYTPAATVIREGVEINLQKDSEIFKGDTIITDSDGAVGIIFSDGAVLTLGPSGELVVDNFLFNLIDKKFSFLSRVIKGSVAFVSGAIGKISPGSVSFKTPTATLGLRGTKILIEVE